MAFTRKFQAYACEGDTIEAHIEGFDVIARLVRDDCPDAPEFRGSENAPVERFPEERQDGFWPSLYKDAPGLLGEADQELVQWTNSPPNGVNHRQRFAEAQREAEAVMTAWRKDEWFYGGIVLSVWLGEIEIERHGASLFGLEVNYPGSDNAYLSEAADELLPEALEAGRKALAGLCCAAVPVPRVEIIVSGGVVQDVIVSNGRAEIIIDDRDNAR